MKLVKKITHFIVGVLAISLMVGCGPASPSSEDSEPISSEEISSEEVSSEEVSSEESSEFIPTAENPLVITGANENSEKIELTGPFTIYTEQGGVPELTKLENGNLSDEIPVTYENMYKAIRVAGVNSSTKNKLQVQDANHTQIFIRSSKSAAFIFNGKDYVGQGTSKTAKEYCLSHDYGYAVNGTGSDYHYMSRDDMKEGQQTTENVLETASGAYNYMFSKGGDGSVNGFSYATCDVLLSEATYIPSDDGGQWNAYIFINLGQGITCDLGLIGSFNPGAKNCYWKMVRNCGSQMHTAGTSTVDHDAKFFVYHDKVVTTSKYYDPDTRACSGFDDLHFEAFAFANGWTLNITNLTTGIVYSFTDTHYDDSNNPLNDNDSDVYGRALIAASYCPVTANVWNWDCGAALDNVVFTNIELTRRIDDDETKNDIEAYRVQTLERFPLYPDEDTFRDGYSQGDFVASHEFSTFRQNKTLDSGFEIFKDQKFITYNVNYNI